jgi:hypothetical protein
MTAPIIETWSERESLWRTGGGIEISFGIVEETGTGIGTGIDLVYPVFRLNARLSWV